MKRIIALLFLALLGSVSLPSLPANALEAPARQLLITPLRNEVTIDAGTAYKGSVTLKNTGTTSLAVSFEAQAFGIQNQNYDYTFFPDSPINEWVHFAESSTTLDAGESYVAQYLISVPIGTEPGGKYLSLFASAVPSISSSISSSERLGSLVYITVPGSITKQGNLLSLNSPLFATDIINWSAAIQNNGTAHFRSQYKVETKTLWGTSIESSKNSNLILPASVRLITGTAPHPRWLGIYTLDYSFDLGDNPGIIETKLLFYTPPTQLISLIGIVGILVLTIRLLVRHKKD